MTRKRMLGLLVAGLLVGCSGLKEALTARVDTANGAGAANVRRIGSFTMAFDDTLTGVTCYVRQDALSCVKVRP